MSRFSLGHYPRSQMMCCVDHPTMVKDGSGWGAMAGVSAAFLAESGFTGAPAVTVEGTDVGDIWADLGQRWRILEQYHKPFPVCRWAQPSVQALLTLRQRYGLDAEAVERIEVSTFHQAIRLAVRHPLNTEQAQYSTAFPVASALVLGRLGPAEVEIGAFDNLQVNRLASGMTFREHDEFNTAFPARRIADVTLHLKDGRRLSSGPVEAEGDPEDPISTNSLRGKFTDYTTPVLGSERAAAIMHKIDTLAPGVDIRSFLELILSPARSFTTV